MSAAIDELAPGTHAAIFARQDAWHRLGTTVTDAFTAQDALEKGHLGGWDVRKLPLTATEITEDGVTTVDVPDQFATVRTNPVTGTVEPLGVVGKSYRPIQNEAQIDLLDAIVDESGAHFEDRRIDSRRQADLRVDEDAPRHPHRREGRREPLPHRQHEPRRHCRPPVRDRPGSGRVREYPDGSPPQRHVDVLHPPHLRRRRTGAGGP